MRKEERFERILAHFKAQMPEVTTELEFGSVFQLLVAVILSAQCTLVKMARALVEHHEGEVPSDMNALLDLPGVGRKTANVIQSVAFGKSTLAVDTHVYRVAHRLGLVSKRANTPFKVEQELVKHIPAEDIPNAHHWLLLHGRYVCTSRKPHCEKCEIEKYCAKQIEGSKLDH